ncbi:MAG: leucine-rich repeat domain-containing protein [Treponema sp.]|jgi:hypothetical protein|nr:leucine-rich repeat domain-containing protein [Treponema sp.]
MKTNLEFGLTENGQAYEVLKMTTNDATEVKIPSVFEGKPVVVIKKAAFKCNASIQKVFIPDSVTIIEGDAFSECVALKSVSFSKGVTKIGSYAFAFCESLEEIIIPDSVTEMGKGVFYDCKALKKVKLPEGIKDVKEKMFQNCASLERIELPDSVTKLGGPFALLGGGHGGVFEGCKSLKEVKLSDKIKKLHDFTFGGCISLTHITLPASLTSMDDIFDVYGQDCKNLPWPELPKGIQKIKSAKNCIVKELKIPKSVTDLGNNDGAFCGAKGLERITVEEGNKNYKSDGNCLIRTKDNALILVGPGGVIPDYVTNIVPHAFESCTGLKHIVLPKSLSSINRGAFAHFKELETIEIPEGVTEISDFTFSHCTGLKNIVLPKSLQSIDYGAFLRCHQLKIEIPENVTNIAQGGKWSSQCGAFEACTGTQITVSSKNKTYKMDGNCLINIPTKTLVKGFADSVIPSYVKVIARGAFSEVKDLVSMVIPEGVKEIEGLAFNECSSLTNLVLPKSLKKIGIRSFEQCKELEIDISAQVELEQWAFQGCKKISIDGIPVGE